MFWINTLFSRENDYCDFAPCDGVDWDCCDVLFGVPLVGEASPPKANSETETIDFAYFWEFHFYLNYYFLLDKVNLRLSLNLFD